MKEVWKKVPDVRCWASNFGRIKSIYNRILNPSLNTKGYPRVCISEGSRKSQKAIEVHRLVVWAFLGKKKNITINHKDCNKCNNRLSNLEYLSNSDNLKHAASKGIFAKRNNRNWFNKMKIIGRYKLSHEKARIIRELVAKRHKQVDLARRFKASLCSINHIVKNRQWIPIQ